MEVVGDERAARPRTGARNARSPRGTSSASRSSCRSPMWWPTQARSPLREAEGVLELGAAAEQRPRRLERQVDARRARSRASAAAASAAGAQRRVDRAQTPSRRCACGSGGRGRGTRRRSRQPLERVGVAVGDRLVGDVAGGHHQRRRRRRAEQQVVKRRVGQHHAEVARARRDRGGDAGAAAPAGDHDRALAARSAAPPRRRVSSTSSRAAPRSGAISANGLSSRCLRARSAATAALVGGDGRRGGSRRGP